MAWKEMSAKQLAASLKINIIETREKQKLMRVIANARKMSGLSRAELARKAGVSAKRVVQIESGVGTSNFSFDILLGMLTDLGIEFKIEPNEHR